VETPAPPKPDFLQRTFAGIFIDLQGQPLSLKLLTILGYLAVFGLLFFTLLVEMAGNSLQTVTYELAGQNNRIPLLVLAVASLAFILGWAYLLAGAAAARARIFLPVLALFALQLFMVTNITFLLVLLDLVFLLAVLIIYGLTFRSPFWRELPGLHFFGWLASVSVVIILSVGTTATDAEVASALSANFSVVLLLTLFFWVLLSLSVIDLGISSGRLFTRLASKFLPFSVTSALIVFVLLIHPAAAALVFWLTKDAFWLLDIVLSVLLILGALVVWVFRRWSDSSAPVFLTLSFATPVVILGLSMAFVGQGFTENLLKAIGLFPPTLLFVGLTTYNLFGMGVSFTRVDGRILPRRARILLYFGILLLVVACMLFNSNNRLQDTSRLSLDFQLLINNLFALSALILGVPYLVWMIWKRRLFLVVANQGPPHPPHFSWLGRLPAPAWVALSLILSCACSCLLLVILFLLVKG
jgi:hypothetical protein